MITIPCKHCTLPSAIALKCSTDNCGITTSSCPACVPTSTCATCGHHYCPAHIGTCISCAGPTCCYCVEKLHGNPAHLDPACRTTAAAGIGGSNAIAINPLAKNLPWHSPTILQSFDPDIKLLTYRYSKAAKALGIRPKDVQAEHFIPNSCFIAGKGRTGPLVPNVGSYSELDALTYWVKDDQKAGTEHKYLTDRERAFCTECEAAGQFADVEQWCDFMQYTTAKSILLHRTYSIGTGVLSHTYYSRARLHAAQQAAYVVRQLMQHHFQKILMVTMSAQLRNGIARGPVPPAIATKAQRFDI